MRENPSSDPNDNRNEIFDHSENTDDPESFEDMQQCTHSNVSHIIDSTLKEQRNIKYNRHGSQCPKS